MSGLTPMKVLHAGLVLMTGLSIAGTIYEAAWGHRWGLVIYGAALSVAGVFIVCLWDVEQE